MNESIMLVIDNIGGHETGVATIKYTCNLKENTILQSFIKFQHQVPGVCASLQVAVKIHFYEEVQC